MRQLWCLAVVVATALVASCAGPAHVVLEAPPSKTAPEAERRAYYVDHAPTAMRSVNYPSTWSEPVSFLIIEDGTRIEHPVDLLPAVEPTSPTALAAQRSESQAEAAFWWTTAGTTAMAVGAFSPLAIPLFVVGDLPGEPREQSVITGLATATAGLVVLAAGGLALGVGVRAAIDAQRERETAYLTYDRALRTRLALPKRLDEPAVAGVTVPVRAAPSRMPPPAPVDPAEPPAGG